MSPLFADPDALRAAAARIARHADATRHTAHRLATQIELAWSSVSTNRWRTSWKPGPICS